MNDKLPPLPKHTGYIAVNYTEIYTVTEVYTADQMRTYAAQAVAERDAEIASLREANERAYNAGFVEASRLHGAEIKRLRAENKALKADAERYRWLRYNRVGTVAPEGRVTTRMELGFVWYSPSWENGERQDSVSLDAAIDRARSKE